MRYGIIIVAVLALLAAPLPVGAQSQTLGDAVTGGLTGAGTGLLIGIFDKDSSGKRRLGKDAAIGGTAGVVGGIAAGFRRDQQQAEQPVYQQQGYAGQPGSGGQQGYGQPAPQGGPTPEELKFEELRQENLQLEREILILKQKLLEAEQQQ